jgi:hypothetical protein
MKIQNRSIFRTSTVRPSRFLALLTVIFFMAYVLLPVPAFLEPVEAAVSATLYGYSANYGGSSMDIRWQNSNLGNAWAEGEWVPYQFVISGIKAEYGTIANMPEIVI